MRGYGQKGRRQSIACLMSYEESIFQCRYVYTCDMCHKGSYRGRGIREREEGWESAVGGNVNKT